jgi:hypothetical protein
MITWAREDRICRVCVHVFLMCMCLYVCKCLWPCVCVCVCVCACICVCMCVCHYKRYWGRGKKENPISHLIQVFMPMSILTRDDLDRSIQKLIHLYFSFLHPALFIFCSPHFIVYLYYFIVKLLTVSLLCNVITIWNYASLISQGKLDTYNVLLRVTMVVQA